jgi:hypothetical protein
MKGIKQLKRWVQEHPWKAIGFTWLFTLLVTLSASGTVTVYMWGVVAAISVIFLFVIHRETRNKTVGVLMIATFLSLGTAPPAKAEVRATENAAVIVAIVVLVVGGVVSCKIVRFCQKNFSPTPTNAPPDDSSSLYFILGDDSAGASYSGSGVEYCWEETWPADSDPTCTDCDTETNTTSAASASLLSSFEWPTPGPLPAPQSIWSTSEQPPVPPDLSIWKMVASHVGGEGVIRSAGFVPKGTNGELPLISRDEFLTRIGTFGISLGGGGGISYYGKAGVPCAPEDCPIMFVTDPVNPGGMPQVLVKDYIRPQRIVLIQRSRDLKVWTTVMKTIVPEGMGVDFEDMTRYSKAFYRVKVQIND